MPYIKNENRERLFNPLYEPNGDLPGNCGELNYILTEIILEYLGKDARYQQYCEVEGVLGHIAKEVYRRRVADYEDEKIKENGDVF